MSATAYVSQHGASSKNTAKPLSNPKYYIMLFFSLHGITAQNSYKQILKLYVKGIINLCKGTSNDNLQR